ncbi:hypothetical protein [Spirosoma aerolatum]|uniref:hypothetical protein n=1 Tax=Spirosoma aerolatum TaxID=1211326 RepID=UPI0009AC9B4C|nr:hypothetical protein [Spirosoma aerolatum]
MNAFLRLLCYDDPSRQSWTQLHPDMPMDFQQLPNLTYGQDMRVGSDDTDPLFWPIYLVANIPLMQEIEDTDIPGKKAILLNVYLVKEECWDYFDVPERVRHILELEDPGHID